MLEESCKLSFAVVRDIFDHGFSRVPVYARERQHVVGLLFVKDLIFVDPEDEVPLAEYLRVFERSIELVDGRAAASIRRASMARRRVRVSRQHAIAPRSRGEPRRRPPHLQARPRPPRVLSASSRRAPPCRCPIEACLRAAGARASPASACPARSAAATLRAAWGRSRAGSGRTPSATDWAQSARSLAAAPRRESCACTARGRAWTAGACRESTAARP